MRKSTKSIELGKNIYSSFKIRMEKISMKEDSVEIAEPKGFADHWKNFVTQESWFTESQEIMVVFHCNTKNQIIGHHLVSIGTVDSTLCHARDVFRAAIANNSTSICLVHSHPSGNTKPSYADERISKELIKCGDILKIPVLDSIVVSPDGESYTSLKDMGII